MRDRLQRLARRRRNQLPGCPHGRRRRPCRARRQDARAGVHAETASISPRGALTPRVIDLKQPVFDQPERVADVRGASPGRIRVLAFEPGLYQARTAAGKRRERNLTSLPAPVEIDGPWEVRFAPNLGAPQDTTFDRLISWTARPEAGISTFRAPPPTSKRCDCRPDALGAQARLPGPRPGRSHGPRQASTARTSVCFGNRPSAST